MYLKILQLCLFPNVIGAIWRGAKPPFTAKQNKIVWDL